VKNGAKLAPSDSSPASGSTVFVITKISRTSDATGLLEQRAVVVELGPGLKRTPRNTICFPSAE